MPPSKRSRTPDKRNDSERGEKANTIIHPMAMYNAVESQRGQLNQIILNKMPDNAIAVTIPKRTQPVTPFKVIRQNGVYEPAINT